MSERHPVGGQRRRPLEVRDLFAPDRSGAGARPPITTPVTYPGVVLVPFREPWCTDLQETALTWEVRRLRCGTQRDTIVVMYSSGPAGHHAATGAFFCGEVISAPPEEVWPQISEGCGLAQHEFQEWFAGRQLAHAIEIKCMRQVNPLAVEFPVPASFVCLDSAKAEHRRVIDHVCA